MATTDPASRSCKDTTSPRAQPSRMLHGVTFIFLFTVCLCARANTAAGVMTGGPIPAPLLQMTGNLKNSVCMLSAGHSRPPRQMHLSLRFLSQLGFSSPFLEEQIRNNETKRRQFNKEGRRSPVSRIDRPKSYSGQSCISWWPWAGCVSTQFCFLICRMGVMTSTSER